MGRQNKKTEKKVDTKQPQSGKIEKTKKDDKKGPTEKVVEKVAKAAGKQVKDVQVSKSVSKKDTKAQAKETKTKPTKEEKQGKKGKKEEKKKAPTPSSSSASSSSASSSSGSSDSSSSSSSSEEQKVTAMDQSGSSSSGSSSSGSGSSSSGSSSGSSSSGSDSESGSGSGSSSSGSDSDSSSGSGSSGSSSESEEKETKKEDGKKRKAESEAAPPAKKQKTEGSNDNEGKIFLGNLSFQITEEDVKKFLADCGTVENIEWIERDGRFSGSGVVTFSSEEAVQKAISKNGSDLLGRTVRIVKNYSRGEAFAGEPSTSVFLNNLPYDVTEEQLNELYSGCGEIVSIRFPQKSGMAFVEFATIDEAKAALAKSFDLSIKGRPVRAEFAKTSRGNQDRPPRQQGGAQGGQKQGGRGNFSTPKPAGGCTFFIGGLPDNVEEKDLHNAFPGCNIANIRWVESGGVFKGVGFVEFADTKEADKAYEIANKGVQIGRRFLRFDWAEPRKPRN